MSDYKNILYLLSLVLLMLTGCEAEAPAALLPDQGEEPVEVRFHAINVGADVTVSRACYSSTSLQEDEIGIWNKFYHNISLTYTEDTTPNLSTTNNEKIYYPYDTKELPIYAYAPYSEEAFEQETQSVLVKSEWEEEDAYSHYITDPIWASDNITRDNATARFAFTHQMARLIMKIAPESGVLYSNYTITLTFDRAQYGQMSLTDGEITPAETGQYSYSETYRNPAGTGGTNDDMPEYYDHTLLPGSKLVSIKVEYAGNIPAVSYVHIFTEESRPDFEAGKLVPMYIDFKAMRQ